MARQEHEGVGEELLLAWDDGHSRFPVWSTRGRRSDPDNAVVAEGSQKAGEGVQDSTVDDEQGDEEALDEEQDVPVAKGLEALKGMW